MRIQFIKTAETYPLRLQVLRPGGEPEDAHFATDRTDGAFHLGARSGNSVIAIASFHPEKHAGLKGWKQFRLRGMAIPEFDPATEHPVISLLEEQHGLEQMGGTMRLGGYPCVIQEGTLAHREYRQKKIRERHRHRVVPSLGLVLVRVESVPLLVVDLQAQPGY